MKIRFLLASDRLSGPAEPMVTLAAQLQERGHQVHFSCKTVRDWCNNPLDEHLEQVGVPWDTQLHLNNKVHPGQFISDVRNLARDLQEHPVDILHCNYKADHWIGALAARISNTPVTVIRSRHHSRLERKDPLHRWLFRHLTHGVIEISHQTAQFDARGLGLDPGKVKVIYGAVDTDALGTITSGTDLRSELGLPMNALLVGYPARLVPKRQPEMLLRALTPLLKEREDVALLFVGRGPMENDLREAFKVQGIENRCFVLGYRDDYLNVVKGLDIVVYLREGTDGSCRALLEAMALGKPILASYHGPIPEILRNGKAGLLYNDGEDDDFRKRLRELIDAPDLRASLSEAAQAVAVQHYSPERRLNDTTAFYEARIAERKRFRP